MLTRDQREVVRRVEATMKLNTEEDNIHVQYQSMADYKIEMSKALDAGSVVKLSRKELETWTSLYIISVTFLILNLTL